MLARFIKDTLAWVAYPRQGGPSVREWRLNSAAIRQEEAAIAENAYYAEQLLNHVPRDMWPALGITPYEEKGEE